MHKPATTPVPELLRTALAHHQADRLADAEALYRQILAREPRQADAMHLLGIVAEQRRQPVLAAQWIEQALSAAPGRTDFAASLARIYVALGRLQDAVVQYEHALASGSAPAGLYNDYGIALHRLGRLPEAIARYRQALTLAPDAPGTHYNLAAALDAGGDPIAQQHYLRALELEPRHAQAHNSLGCWLAARGRLEDAVPYFERALALQPDFFDGHNNLGFVLRELKRYDQAERHLMRAIELNPENALAQNNLGTVLYEQGQRDRAVEQFCRALRIEPNYADAYNNLGLALTGDGVIEHRVAHLIDAIEAAARGMLQPPGSTGAGATLATRFAPGAASELMSDPMPGVGIDALPPVPMPPQAAMSNHSRFEAALLCFRRALTLDPNHAGARSNLLFHLNHAGEASPAVYLQEACAYGEWAAARAHRYEAWPASQRGMQASGGTKKAARLRIGFVSGDLRNHPVGYFLESVVAHLDPQRFELTAYATQGGEDSVSARLKRHVSHWHRVQGMSDAALAQHIHDDGMHILVDLAGHTAGNRLPVFAWKPAPVQVAWLGYFASTGVKEIDYILCDARVLPESEAAHFVERPWRLPDCYLCFTPPHEDVEAGPLPLLENGYVTFGCFNKLSKMNDRVVGVWSRVLKAVPGSRLMLKAKELNDPVLRAATLTRFAAQGIDAGRLILSGYTPRAAYLAEYGRVDIALDPFPYPGGTTTVEALWMGVPVLSLRGDRFLSHAGESLLGTAGLGDWVAADEDDYVAKASRFSADAEWLSSLRGGLRVQMLSSALCDAPRFASALGEAFEGMWAEHSARAGAGAGAGDD
jgi:predicted O-linked N-acetylglucosamine transferase (SPINDLY family)